MVLPLRIGGGMTKYTLNDETCESWLNAYGNYLTKVLGVAPATRTSYLLIAGRFLAHLFKDEIVDRSMFTPSAIIEFVAADAAPRKGKGPGTTIAATRSFLRFSNGVVSSHVETIIPHMWRPRQAALPDRLTDSEIQKVLQLADDGTKKGFRNYALVLLFARLGLRADEAARLSLDDIDWVNGHILIKAGKTRRERKLPLSQELAEAVLRYLKRSRGRSKYREVFLQADAPYRPYLAGSIGKVVTRLLARAGIFRSSCGPHLFRHTLASSMVNHGATFKEIADVLGHQSLITTAVYAKLDLNTLAKIALPWPRR
jgi:integrase/recombinase XerD